MIKTFIGNNKITFNEGERNASVTTLIGYSQHLGLSKSKLKGELIDQIEEDSFIEKEINRLFDYCKNKNYKDFWNTSEAKDLYKF